MSKLAGKTAIVTGAARGLGRAYALRLASLGAKVAVVDKDLTSYKEFEADRRAMTAASTVQEITNAGGVALGFQLDVGDLASLTSMAKAVHDAWGSIDILVANAGGGSGTMESTAASELDPEHLDTVLKRNLYGTIYTVKAVAPYMKAQRSGKIVTTSSLGGSAATPAGGYAHYGAAKAGIAMYTRYLAQDLGPYGINSNCIAAGFIGTARIMPQLAANSSLFGQIPLRRFGTVEDVANLVEFLASEAASYINGAVIPIDGGVNRGAA